MQQDATADLKRLLIPLSESAFASFWVTFLSDAVRLSVGASTIGSAVVASCCVFMMIGPARAIRLMRVISEYVVPCTSKDGTYRDVCAIEAGWV